MQAARITLSDWSFHLTFTKYTHLAGDGRSTEEIQHARRRLSTMNDKAGPLADELSVEGMSITNEAQAAAQQGAATAPSGAASSGGFVVNSYGGYSKKGYAPYNPRKKNQDSLVMAEDPKTRSLFLCVMDGHGEDGDKVSQNIKGKLANYLFNHRDFASDVKSAISDVLARCESEILREASIETDFSGTTLTCAVIRDNKCIMANVGDSRTSLAYRGPGGKAIGVNLTIDHKPDLPAEKVRSLVSLFVQPRKPAPTLQLSCESITPLLFNSPSHPFPLRTRNSTRHELRPRGAVCLQSSTTTESMGPRASGSATWTFPASP